VFTFVTIERKIKMDLEYIRATEKSYTPIRDDRELAEQLRQRGYWVQILKRRVYGAQTNTWYGDSYEISGIALWPGEAVKLKKTDGLDEEFCEFEIFTNGPIYEDDEEV
jgi:hypothetical protein